MTLIPFYLLDFTLDILHSKKIPPLEGIFLLFTLCSLIRLLILSPIYVELLREVVNPV